MGGVGAETSGRDEPTAVYTDLQGNPLRGYIAITRDGQALGLVRARSTYKAEERFLELAAGPTIALWCHEGAGWRMQDGGDVPPYVVEWCEAPGRNVGFSAWTERIRIAITRRLDTFRQRKAKP